MIYDIVPERWEMLLCPGSWCFSLKSWNVPLLNSKLLKSDDGPKDHRIHREEEGRQMSAYICRNRQTWYILFWLLSLTFLRMAGCLTFKDSRLLDLWGWRSAWPLRMADCLTYEDGTVQMITFCPWPSFPNNLDV